MTAARRGGWPGPRKIEVNVTMPPDQLARVEAYARRCGVKRSEAIRRCVAAGLHRLGAEETRDEEVPDSELVSRR